MEQIITILLTVLSIGLSAFLIYNKANKKNGQVLWLGRMIGGLSLLLLLMQVITYYADWQNPLYNLLSLLFYVVLISVPPLMYVYLLHALPQEQLEHRGLAHLVHFLPSVVLLVINIFGFLVIVFGNPDSVFHQHTEQIVFFVNFTIITFFFILQNLYYLFLGVIYWNSARSVKTETTAKAIRWIGRYLLGYTFFLMVAYCQQISFKAYTGWSLSTIFLGYFVFLFWHQYFQPKMDFIELRQLLVEGKRKRSDDDPLIDEELVAKIKEKLEIALNEKKVYQQSDLSLSSLSKELDTNDKYLRYVIGKVHSGGFVAFVNQYRVEDAKAMLSDESFQIYTVESIGQMAGFKSKSSFYAAFKEITDMTPHQYRQQGVKNNEPNTADSD